MAAPINIRQINRRDVLDALLRTGSATRSDLARATGLSQPTTGKIVEELLSDGILQATTAPRSMVTRMGRPGHDLTLNETDPCFLGVQLGVIHTRLARLFARPPANDDWEQTIVTPPTAKAWAAAVRSVARPLLTPSMKAVLVSVPGVLDNVSGRSILSPNLRWLEGQHVAQMLQGPLGIRVEVVQEIRCLALGHCAIDRSADNLLLVDFGTGVGSAAVVGGRLIPQPLPFSGELGHTPVPGRTQPCGCGGVGCLETIVGREHILSTLGIAKDDWHEPWGRAIAELRPNKINAPFRDALEAAGLGIAGALNVSGLDRVVVTGFLSDLPDHAMRLLSDRVQSAAVAGRYGTVHTAPAPRRRLAGLATVGIERILAPV